MITYLLHDDDDGVFSQEFESREHVIAFAKRSQQFRPADRCTAVYTADSHLVWSR